MIGLYAIVNTVNNKSYVGSSNNIGRRIKEHKNELRRNEHFCKHLQNSWNKHGESLFQFKTIGVCETLENARELEEAFLECFIEKLYNSKTKAIGFKPEEHPAKKPNWHMKTVRQRLTDDERKQKYGGSRGVKRDSEAYIEGAKKRLANPEYVKKLSESCKGKRDLVTCPNCGLVGGGGNMRRYHFDNCRGKK